MSNTDDFLALAKDLLADESIIDHDNDAAVLARQWIDLYVRHVGTLAAEVERLRDAVLDIDRHAAAVATDEDGFNSGGYVISIGSLHRALGIIGHTAAKPREHAVQLVTAHGDRCEGCEQAKEITLDAVARARRGNEDEAGRS